MQIWDYMDVRMILTLGSSKALGDGWARGKTHRAGQLLLKVDCWLLRVHVRQVAWTQGTRWVGKLRKQTIRRRKSFAGYWRRGEEVVEVPTAGVSVAYRLQPPARGEKRLAEAPRILQLAQYACSHVICRIRPTTAPFVNATRAHPSLHRPRILPNVLDL